MSLLTSTNSLTIALPEDAGKVKIEMKSSEMRIEELIRHVVEETHCGSNFLAYLINKESDVTLRYGSEMSSTFYSNESYVRNKVEKSLSAKQGEFTLGPSSSCGVVVADSLLTIENGPLEHFMRVPLVSDAKHERMVALSQRLAQGESNRHYIVTHDHNGKITQITEVDETEVAEHKRRRRVHKRLKRRNNAIEEDEMDNGVGSIEAENTRLLTPYDKTTLLDSYEKSLDADHSENIAKDTAQEKHLNNPITTAEKSPSPMIIDEESSTRKSPAAYISNEEEQEKNDLNQKYAVVNTSKEKPLVEQASATSRQSATTITNKSNKEKSPEKISTPSPAKQDNKKRRVSLGKPKESSVRVPVRVPKTENSISSPSKMNLRSSTVKDTSTKRVTGLLQADSVSSNPMVQNNISSTNVNNETQTPKEKKKEISRTEKHKSSPSLLIPSQNQEENKEHESMNLDVDDFLKLNLPPPESASSQENRDESEDRETNEKEQDDITLNNETVQNEKRIHSATDKVVCKSETEKNSDKEDKTDSTTLKLQGTEIKGEEKSDANVIEVVGHKDVSLAQESTKDNDDDSASSDSSSSSSGSSSSGSSSSSSSSGSSSSNSDSSVTKNSKSRKDPEKKEQNLSSLEKPKQTNDEKATLNAEKKGSDPEEKENSEINDDKILTQLSQEKIENESQQTTAETSKVTSTEQPKTPVKKRTSSPGRENRGEVEGFSPLLSSENQKSLKVRKSIEPKKVTYGRKSTPTKAWNDPLTVQGNNERPPIVLNGNMFRLYDIWLRNKATIVSLKGEELQLLQKRLGFTEKSTSPEAMERLSNLYKDYVRKHIGTLNRDKLQAVCRDYNLKVVGLKSDLLGRVESVFEDVYEGKPITETSKRKRKLSIDQKRTHDKGNTKPTPIETPKAKADEVMRKTPEKKKVKLDQSLSTEKVNVRDNIEKNAQLKSHETPKNPPEKKMTQSPRRKTVEKEKEVHDVMHITV